MSYTFTDLINAFMNMFWQFVGAVVDAVILFLTSILENVWDYGTANPVLILLVAIAGIVYFVAQSKFRSRY